VPVELSRKWVGDQNLRIVPGATHDDFGKFELKI